MRSDHSYYMQRALSLAVRGKGHVNPNPCVGCVVVKGNKIIAEAFHEKYGSAHAEVNALRKAGSRAKGATLYLTLEPCAHFGKTPPCTPLIIQSGIKSVFIAMKDPNPLMRGKSIRSLKKAHVNVHVGLEEKAAQNLNRSFIKWMRTDKPYVILKSAMTLDGKTATKTGQSKWITSKNSRALVHQFRAESDAVLVGISTVLNDNPELTTHGKGRNPLRVILDPTFRIKPSLKMLKDKKAPTLIITSKMSSSKKKKRLEKMGVLFLRVKKKAGKLPLNQILQTLSKLGVSQLLVEGGGETSWNFVQQKQVDEVLFFIAPKILGGHQSHSPVDGMGFNKINQALPLKSLFVGRLGSDILIRGMVN